jgi:hypothetical protein
VFIRSGCHGPKTIAMDDAAADRTIVSAVTTISEPRNQDIVDRGFAVLGR